MGPPTQAALALTRRSGRAGRGSRWAQPSKLTYYGRLHPGRVAARPELALTRDESRPQADSHCEPRLGSVPA
eukprot:236311-Hanusia_phi.AAC.1